MGPLLHLLEGGPAGVGMVYFGQQKLQKDEELRYNVFHCWISRVLPTYLHSDRSYECLKAAMMMLAGGFVPAMCDIL